MYVVASPFAFPGVFSCNRFGTMGLCESLMRTYGWHGSFHFIGMLNEIQTRLNRLAIVALELIEYRQITDGCQGG